MHLPSPEARADDDRRPSFPSASDDFLAVEGLLGGKDESQRIAPGMNIRRRARIERKVGFCYLVG